MIKNLFRISIFILCLSTQVQAQVPPNSLEFIRQFKAIEQDLVRERIYLHTDRDWYFHGDRIWFSAYVVAGPYNFASGLSEVLYVELIDPDGDLIDRVNIEITAGRGEGSITFEKSPDEAGRYRLRAYTAWAVNFGESYIFEKDIDVFKDDLELELDALTEDVDVQFFPESGHLVAGLPTRVGVKAIASNGYGIDVTGTVYDENNEVVSFESSYKGMGYFEFEPESSESYYALINGTRYDLPEVQNEGTVLKVVDEGDIFSVDIASTRLQMLQTPLLFAHVRGEVFAAEMIQFQNGTARVIFPKTQFPTGVVHFTLLNDEGLPEAERLSFSKNDVDQVQVDANLMDEEVSFRQRTGFQFLLRNSDATGASGTASISVYDDSIQPYNSFATNIITRFFLESEIEGYIENPGFYFSDDVNASSYADLLMMTQGWRAFDMSQVMGVDLYQLFSFPEKGFRISGTITGGIFGREVKDAPLFFSMGEEGDLSIITTDDNGEFLVNELDVTGSKTYEIKANTESGRENISIQIDDQFAYLPEVDEQVSKVVPSIEIISTEPTLDSDEDSIELITERAAAASEDAEIFIEADLKGELDEITVTSDRINDSEAGVATDYATQIGQNPSGMGTYVDLDERTDLLNYRIQEVINSLPGVSVIGNELQIETNSVSFNEEAPPLVLVNGVNTDFASVLLLQPEDIKSVSVLRSAVDLAIFGAEGTGGALIVQTRRGTRVGATKGFVDGVIQGYQIPATFYSPRYGVDVPTELAKKDNRITLHWDPTINFSERGIQILYWGNDIPSTYRVELEGITETGNPFYFSDIFEIIEE